MSKMVVVSLKMQVDLTPDEHDYVRRYKLGKEDSSAKNVLLVRVLVQRRHHLESDSKAIQLYSALPIAA